MVIAHVNLAAGFRGGERQTQLLIEGLAGEGWRQRLVARRGSELARRCDGIPQLEIAAVGNNPVSAAAALGGAGLVHVHEARALQAAWLNALLRHRPYLVTRRVQKGPGRTWLNRAMYRRAAAVVAVSGAIADSLRGLEPKLNIEVVPDASSGLAADASEVEAIRKRFLGDAGGLLIGNVAALVDSHKGQRQIIEVARRLRDDAPDARFLLIGSGADEAGLRAAAADLPNLAFTGFVDNVGDYLEALDLFYYPSRHEGLGSVLLDAMAFGLPIVATRVGGIPEIVGDPANGYLCAVDDIGAQADALARLIRDPQLRQRIGEANRSRAAQFSPARMTGRYIEIYRRLMNGAAGEFPQQ